MARLECPERAIYGRFPPTHCRGCDDAMPKRRHRPLTPEQKAEIEACIKAQAEGRLPPIVSDGPSRHARYMGAARAPGPATAAEKHPGEEPGPTPGQE